MARFDFGKLFNIPEKIYNYIDVEKIKKIPKEKLNDEFAFSAIFGGNGNVIHGARNTMLGCSNVKIVGNNCLAIGIQNETIEDDNIIKINEDYKLTEEDIFWQFMYTLQNVAQPVERASNTMNGYYYYLLCENNHENELQAALNWFEETNSIKCMGCTGRCDSVIYTSWIKSEK